MVLGTADWDDDVCTPMAQTHQCVVVSVDYRLAPEDPCPAQLHDCYASLKWFSENASRLGVSAERIAIGGASAGGGLAAGTALMARDNGGPNLILQLLVCRTDYSHIHFLLTSAPNREDLSLLQHA